jgi:hypothetical protein
MAEVSGQLHAPAALPTRKDPEPKSGLDDVEKRKFLAQQGLELRLLGLAARS